MSKRRSPIKRQPLRQPGESVQEHFNEVLWDKVLFWMMPPLLLAIWAIWEWLALLLNLPRMPLALLAAALMVTGIAVWRIRKARRYLHQLKRVMEGERTVGQALEAARAYGYQIFHDIPCGSRESSWNIDHVAIGPGGVFAIETKTISKPDRGDARVTFDGETLLVDGRPLDRDPVRQATASARHVQKILTELSGTNERVEVRPVLVFPGWYIDETKRPRDGRFGWVLNEESLPKWLKTERTRLSESQIAAYAGRIGEYVRRSTA